MQAVREGGEREGAVCTGRLTQEISACISSEIVETGSVLIILNIHHFVNEFEQIHLQAVGKLRKRNTFNGLSESKETRDLSGLNFNKLSDVNVKR